MRDHSKQTGVSLISAIFLVVVLSGLAVTMTKLGAMQHTGSTLSLQISRAWYAARSGSEWMADYVRSNSACPTAGTNFAVGQFTVLLDSCTSSSFTEGSTTYNVYNVELTAASTGLSYGSPEYAARSLQFVIDDLP